MLRASPRYSPVGSKLFVNPNEFSQPTRYTPPFAPPLGLAPAEVGEEPEPPHAASTATRAPPAASAASLVPRRTAPCDLCSGTRVPFTTPPPVGARNPPGHQPFEAPIPRSASRKTRLSTACGEI